MHTLPNYHHRTGQSHCARRWRAVENSQIVRERYGMLRDKISCAFSYRQVPKESPLRRYVADRPVFGVQLQRDNDERSALCVQVGMPVYVR